VHRENVDPEKVKTYLFTSAHHTLIDYIRKAKRESSLDWKTVAEPVCSHSYSDLQEILHEAVNVSPRYNDRL